MNRHYPLDTYNMIGTISPSDLYYDYYWQWIPGKGFRSVTCTKNTYEVIASSPQFYDTKQELFDTYKDSL